MKYGLVAVLLGCLALPASADVVMPDGLDLGEGRSVGRVRDTVLKPEQARLWSGFREKAGYFGAMYVHDTEDTAFVAMGFHDLATAHAAALKGCQEVARLKAQDAGSCRLFATVVPEGTDLNARQGRGLGQGARADFLGRYTECQTCEGKSGYGAFAIGGGAEYGMSWQWPTEAEARGSALAHCAAAVASNMAQYSNEGRRWVKARGLDKCRVIHVARRGN